jgi:hypothetical protein
VRRGKVEALEEWPDTRQKQQSNHSSYALQANYRVIHYFPKDSKPFSDWDFRRQYSQHRVQEICPKEKAAPNTSNLSHETKT